MVRHDELAALESLLDGLGSGRGCAVALVGEPGIGKTRLMAALTAAARAAGLPSLATYGSGVAASWTTLPERVVQAAGRTGIVVTVDDLHLADSDQLPVVEELMRLSVNTAVLLLVAYRERQVSRQMAATLSRACAAGVLRQWPIGPLLPTQTRELLGDRPDLEQIHREGSGNPLYMKALAVGDQQTMTDAGTALLGELAALAEPELRVAQAAAVLGEPHHPELVAAVADLSMAQVFDALDALTRLNLVRSATPAPMMAFRHPVVCQIIYDGLEPGYRLAAHLRAAAELARLGAPAEQRAHHIARSAQFGQPEHVATLVNGARKMLHSAPATAAEWLETALTLIREGDDLWYQAQLLLARALMLSGRAYDSRDLFHVLLPRAANVEAGELASTVALAGRVERMLGRYAEAGALVREGLASLSESHPPAAVALHTELADLALDRQDHASALNHTAEAVEIARQHGDRLGEVSALAQATMVHARAADLDAASATASAAGELIDAMSDSILMTELSCLYLVGMAEAALERLSDAERHLSRGIALSRRTGQAFILPTSLKALGEAQFRLGRLSTARDTLDEANRLTEQDSGPATRAIVGALRAHTELWLRTEDDTDEAMALAETAVGVADGLPWRWAVLVRCLQAELQLHLGHPQRCQKMLLDALGGPLMPRLSNRRRSRWCDLLTAAALAEGDLEAAASWVKLAEPSAEWPALPTHRGFAQRARMRLHAALGEVDLAATTAHSAVESFSEGGFAIEAGYTLVVIATMLLDAAYAQGVEEWLHSADVVAEQCGSKRLSDQVRGQRSRLAHQLKDHPPVDSLSRLTEREREIAMLASTGITSVEMGRKLYLSVRTVDCHLGRIYRKLGLSNRTGLIRAVLELGAPGADSPSKGLNTVSQIADDFADAPPV